MALKTKKSDVHTHQLTGIELVEHVKNLIGLLQKHRGLSAAWCQGDSKVVPELGQIKSEIKRIMLALEPSISGSDRWGGFCDHWSRLAANKGDVTAENSFKQHTHMISNVLYLLEDVAEMHHLSSDFFPEYNNIGYVWRELLSITESVGQSRAVGTASVTAGVCSSVERIRLKFLRQHITQVSEKVLKNLTAPDKEMNNLIEDGLRKTRFLTSAIVNEILDTDEITMSRNDYFELATDTMASLNKVFEYQLKQIKQTIITQK